MTTIARCCAPCRAAFTTYLQALAGGREAVDSVALHAGCRDELREALRGSQRHASESDRAVRLALATARLALAGGLS